MLSKKASLDLSVQAIVVVVIAMTLLGLGLGFVRNIFGSMTKVSSETFSKISDELGQKLSTGDEKLIFSSVQLAVERGKSSLEGVGIKNEENYEIKYGIIFIPVKCAPAVDAADCTTENIAEWFTYVDGPEAYTLGAGQNHVKRVDIKIPTDAKTGLYLLKAFVYQGPEDPMASGTLTCDSAGFSVAEGVASGCREFDSTEIFLTIT